ncbi:UDP-glucose dehydrogenase family protein [Chelativorans alearense]|uniref:UDP-glucose dehydrogenase family protein n=1 Tax=Chelativorans alearense TaxID=2681495 RepID=UPI0013D25BED|nr:UDP-glucose/GDP-mannose dehydrogenase family protein [Chelativorans alearense]
MKVTVFGTGYVGLVQAAVLAEAGFDVVCVDVDADRIERLRQGRVPIYEPGLDPLVKENCARGRLCFTTDAAEGVRHGLVQLIAVGTPPREDGSVDLKQVFSAAETVAVHMEAHRVIAIKSTVPVGTADLVAERIRKTIAVRGRSTLTFDVASNPEFLKEGSAVADCRKPDRIVIGASSKAAEETLRKLYAPYNRNHEKIVVMDVRSAEMTKYAANCMLATKISFMNEMANLAEAVGADIEKVRLGIGSDPRIGYHFIYPGAGYGGSCFPKDVRAMIAAAADLGLEADVLKAVDDRNRRQKEVLVHKIMKHFAGDIGGKTFALWGLAFKPDTDDMREAPSRAIMEALWQAGAKVRAYDPAAMPECRRIYGERPDLVLADSCATALHGADALVIATEWKAFMAPDFGAIKAALSTRTIFDGRNLYDPEVVAGHGIQYYCIGRPVAAPSDAAAVTAIPRTVGKRGSVRRLARIQNTNELQ